MTTQPIDCSANHLSIHLLSAYYVQYIFQSTEKKKIVILKDHAVAKLHAPRVLSRSFRFSERVLNGDVYPARFVPSSLERDSHTPLEIANICGPISNR